MTEKEKMLAGEYYMASDPQLVEERLEARRLTRLYNQTEEWEDVRRRELLGQLLGGIGHNCYIEPTFRCDYGKNIRVGDNFYANFDCVILDVGPVTIGDNCVIGANSVVTKNVPENTVVTGNPARVVCSLSEFREKNGALMENTKVFGREYRFSKRLTEEQKNEMREAVSNGIAFID